MSDARGPVSQAQPLQAELTAAELEAPDVPLPSMLRLPRELRDQIYNYVFSIPDDRGSRALRIERRHIKYFAPTAATILLLLHHEELLLNQQICAEALECLFKKHTVFLSCGPHVLKTFLSRIEADAPKGWGRQWLKWLFKIELDWVTFPNLRNYPPDRTNGKDEWWWENDGQEVDVDYIPSDAFSSQGHHHYDEYDYEGSAHYDDNLYGAQNSALYPQFPARSTAGQNIHMLPDSSDPFGFATHYPFVNPLQGPSTADAHGQPVEDELDEIETKLDMLVDMEVKPLFSYLATSTFALRSITVPLYFISKRTYQRREMARPGYALPLKVRYWVHVAVHALAMLLTPPNTTGATRLKEVRVKYRPWDIWASMDPSDNLERMVREGVWFRGAPFIVGREGEGEAFRALWQILRQKGFDVEESGLGADVRLVRWDGDLDKDAIGNELEVVFRLGGGGGSCASK